MSMCSYSNGHDSCPLTGTTSDTIRATPDVRWWCRFHAATHGDRKVADQLLYAIKRGEIQANRTDWRDELMADLLANRPRAAA